MSPKSGFKWLKFALVVFVLCVGFRLLTYIELPSNIEDVKNISSAVFYLAALVALGVYLLRRYLRKGLNDKEERFRCVTFVLSVAVGFTMFFYMFSTAEPIERTEFFSESVFIFFWLPFLAVWTVYGAVKYVIKGFDTNKKEGFKRLKQVVSVTVWFLSAFSFFLLGGSSSFFPVGAGDRDGIVIILLFLILFSVLGGFLGLLLLKIIYWLVPKIVKAFRNKTKESPQVD